MKINLIIERLENAEAILKDENGRSINWPSDLLPADAKVNDKITFNVGQKDGLAKDILNEILSAE